MSPDSATFDIFISYASADLALAETLHARLTGAGFSVWFDRARLRSGFDWHAEIEQGCEASRLVLPILTPRWKRSEWTRYETYGAGAVLPLLCEGDMAAVMTPPLTRWQANTLDPLHAGDAAWDMLYADIRTQLAKPVPARTERLTDLPFAQNDHFVGREADMLKICEELHQNPAAVLTQGRVRALAALGGVGKTTLACEYARHFWRLYPQIFWVDARLGYDAQFARMHDLLFPAQTGPGLQDADKAQRALRELNGRPERLLVIDNAADETTVQAWIPHNGGCHTLITSRFDAWSAVIRSIHLFALDPESARSLLLSRAGRQAEGAELTACDTLAQRLGHLPLALEQAAAYIAIQGPPYGFVQYLDLFEKVTARLLSLKVLGSTQYPDPVITTWSATIDRLSPESRAILRLCSCMADTPIPNEVFFTSAQLVCDLATTFGAVTPLADDPAEAEFRVREAIAGLSAYSMVRADGDTVQVHNLVQTVERLNAGSEAEETAISGAVIALAAVFQKVEFETWPLCRRVFPHAQFVAHLASDDLDAPLAFLLHQSGIFSSQLAKYAQAEPLERRALAIWEASQERNDLAVVTSLNHLALILYWTNRLSEAGPLIRRALAIGEASVGQNHPDVACCLNSLGELLRVCNRLAEAEPLIRRAVDILEAGLGPDHPLVATSLNNIGLILLATNRLAEAERLFRRAISIREASQGMNHPDLAANFNGLGEVLRAANRLSEAYPIFRRALDISEASFGPDHTDVALSLNNLAEILQATHRFSEAEPLFRRALAIQQESLGPDHPQVARSLNNLATLLHSITRFDEAEPLYCRALSIFETSLGPDHPDVAEPLNNLASLMHATNRQAQAEPLFRRALLIREASLGRDHPSVAKSLQDLAFLLQATGLLAEAEPLCRRALAIQEASLSPDHPHLAESLYILAMVLRDTDRLVEAKPLYYRAMAIRRANSRQD